MIGETTSGEEDRGRSHCGIEEEGSTPCNVTADVLVVLESNDQAPRHARQLMSRVSCATHHATTLDVAQLLVSEVVTNAVLHGTPPITLQITCIEDVGLRVDVTDAAPSTPVLQHLGVAADHGRGVALMDMLSDEWGVEPLDPGKRVWFRLTPRSEDGTVPRPSSAS
jgi:anti-sigma regulatory factor (Ser/Thr protein kinase)